MNCRDAVNLDEKWGGMRTAGGRGLYRVDTPAAFGLDSLWHSIAELQRRVLPKHPCTFMDAHRQIPSSSFLPSNEQDDSTDPAFMKAPKRKRLAKVCSLPLVIPLVNFRS